MDRIYRGPRLTIILKDEDLQPELFKTEKGKYYEEPKMMIEAITLVTCTNYPDGQFGSDCALDDAQPIPEKIEFRYGVWISNKEDDKRFPPIPDEAYVNEPDIDHENYEEWLEEMYEFRRKVRNKPEYKKVREAKRAAMDREVDWHTHTIYPQQILEKYHKEMGFINRIWASIVDYTITFHYDMSVTEKDEIMYLDPAVPW